MVETSIPDRYDEVATVGNLVATTDTQGTARRKTEYRAATDFQRPVYCILGLPVDALTMEQAAARIRDSAKARQRCFLSTPNLNFVIGTMSDPAFRESVIHSDLSVADGMPLVWIARAIGIPIRERVAGSSLFEELRRKCEQKLSVYFFGGPAGVASGARESLNAQASALACVGAQSPGFGSVDDMSAKELIDRINASHADILVVSIGAKKGQEWIENNLVKLNVPIISGLGAVINFVAGTVRRAPAWLQRLGFEWIWRIKEEPSLWRRYFFDGLSFAKLLATRVIPCALYVRLRAPDSDRLARARMSLSHYGSVCNMRLSGTWTQHNLGPLREAFASATCWPCNIWLDFERVDHVDSACIGLLSLLYGHQRKTGRGLALTRLSPHVRLLIRLHCAEYLMERLPNA